MLWVTKSKRDKRVQKALHTCTFKSYGRSRPSSNTSSWSRSGFFCRIGRIDTITSRVCIGRMVDRSGSSILVVIFVKFAWSCSICGVAIGHRGTMSAFTNSSSAVWRRRVHFNNHYLVTFKSTVPGWNLDLVFINTMRTGWRPRQVKLPLRPRQRIFSLSNHNKWRLKTKWRVVFFLLLHLKFIDQCLVTVF